MAIPAKLGVLSAGAATIGVGGTGIGMVMSSYSPDWKSISSESNTSCYSSGYAKDYLPYLVSAEKSENDGGGEGSLKNRYINDGGKKGNGGFKSVKSDDQGSSLKAACLSAYKATTENIKKGTDKPTTDGHFFEEDIGKYCSYGGTTIKTIKDNQNESYTETNAYGGDANADKLVSVQEEKNNGFWELKEKDFFGSTSNPSGATGSSQSVFKDLYDQFKSNRNGNMLVREKCKESYGKTSSDTKYPENDVFKFCSIKGSK